MRPLHEIAHGRAGDKGDTSNISVIAYREEDWPLIREEVTAEKIEALFKRFGPVKVRRYELPNLMALNFVTENALGGGVDAELAPEVQRLEVEEGDVILLCSDGLTKHVENEEIARVLADYPSAQKAADVLVEAANEGGGTDNITVVVASPHVDSAAAT